MNYQSKVVVGVLAGVAVGAVIALLFSPEKGSDLRENIADSLKGLYNDAKDKAASEYDRMNSYKDSATRSAQSRAKSGIDDLGDAIHS